MRTLSFVIHRRRLVFFSNLCLKASPFVRSLLYWVTKFSFSAHLNEGHPHEFYVSKRKGHSFKVSTKMKQS